MKLVPAALIAAGLLAGLTACGSSTGSPSVFNNANQPVSVTYPDGSTHSVKPQGTLKTPTGAELVIPSDLSCTWHTDNVTHTPKDIGPGEHLTLTGYVFLEGCLSQNR